MAEFSAGKVYIPVVPSLRGFHTQLAAEMKRVREKVSVNVVADTAKANVELANVERKAKALDGKDVAVDVKVTGTNFAIKGVSNLTTAFSTLGGSAIPIAAALTAGAGTLGSALLSAGGAGGVFAASVAGQTTAMKEAQETIKREQDQLAGYTKGTKEFAEQQKLVNGLWKDFNSSFGPAARGLENVKGAWGAFLDKTRPVTLQVMGDSMNTLADILPKLVPLSNKAGRAIGSLVADFDKFADTKKFDSILGFFERTGPPAIKSFGRTFGNVALGFFELFEAFEPFQKGFLSGMEGMAVSFRKWAANLDKTEGFKDFMSYVIRNLPDVKRLFGGVASFAVKLLEAMAPLAEIQLRVLVGFFDLLNKMPPNLLRGIAIGVGTIVLGIKAWSIWTKAVTVATGALTAAQWLLNAAVRANPFVRVVTVLVALGAALVVAYKKNEDFRKFVNESWKKISDAVQTAWTDYIKPALKALGEFIREVVVPAVKWLWEKVKQFWNFINDDTKTTWQKIKVVLGNAWEGMKKLSKLAWEWIKEKLAEAWQAIKQKAADVWADIKQGLADKWSDIKKDVADKISDIKQNLADKWSEIKQGIADKMSEIKQAIADKWSDIKQDIADKISDVKQNLADAWGDIKSKAAEVWSDIKRGIADRWSDIKSNVKETANDVKTLLSDVWGDIKKNASSAWKGIVKAIKSAFDLVKKTVGTPIHFVLETIINDKLVAGFNKIADFVGVDKDNQLGTIDTSGIPHFATGGVLPGRSIGKDNLLIAAAGGEAIMRQEFVDAMGHEYVNKINHAARNGGREAVKALHETEIRKQFGGPKAHEFVGDNSERTILPPGFAAGGVFSQAAIDRAKRFAQSKNGPYQMGGTGPEAYDCTGFMSDIAHVLRGNPQSAPRMGATSSAPWTNWGWKNGPGQFSVGWSTAGNIPGSSYGHAAGTLDGLNVESSGSVGPHTGPSARGAFDNMFDHIMHLGSGEFTATGSATASGGFSLPGWVSNPLDTLKNAFSGLLDNPVLNSPLGGLLKAIPGKLADSMGSWLKDKVNVFSDDASIGGSSMTLKAGSGTVKQIVFDMARQMGWAGPQLQALDALITQESSWNPQADNPSSSAAGLFQKMTSIHGPLEDTVAGQARWGLNYIKQQYGSPIKAWSFHKRNNWYDEGGWLKPGETRSHNGTGKPEAVLTNEQWRALAALASQARPNGAQMPRRYAGPNAHRGDGDNGHERLDVLRSIDRRLANRLDVRVTNADAVAGAVAANNDADRNFDARMGRMGSRR